MNYPLYINGKNRKDTSAYTRRLFLEHIYEGKGGAYFDFSGDISPIIQHIPVKRTQDAILFCPTDTDYPVGLNPIHTVPPSTILNVLKSTWHYDSANVATPNFDLYVYATIAALRYNQDSTLRAIVHMLKKPHYRKQVTNQISDPDLADFWSDYETLSGKDKDQITSSTLNKIYALVTDPVVRNIIGQKTTSFTLNNTSIMIASFPQELGREKGSFLATLLLATLPAGMLTILDGGHRIGFSAVLDAIHRLPLVFSHQFAAQLTPELYETLIGTAATLVAFRTSPTDAKRLSPEFYLFPQDDKLNELGPGSYYIRDPTTTDRHQHKVQQLDFPSRNPEQVVRVSRQLNVIAPQAYGTPRERVEAEIAAFFAIDDKPKKRSRSAKFYR